jgi:hypothetical protein
MWRVTAKWQPYAGFVYFHMLLDRLDAARHLAPKQMQIPRFRCKMTLHLIPEPEEKASELLRDLTANDSSIALLLVCLELKPN